MAECTVILATISNLGNGKYYGNCNNGGYRYAERIEMLNFPSKIRILYKDVQRRDGITSAYRKITAN